MKERVCSLTSLHSHAALLSLNLALNDNEIIADFAQNSLCIEYRYHRRGRDLQCCLNQAVTVLKQDRTTIKHAWIKSVFHVLYIDLILVNVVEEMSMSFRVTLINAFCSGILLGNISMPVTRICFKNFGTIFSWLFFETPFPLNGCYPYMVILWLVFSKK